MTSPPPAIDEVVAEAWTKTLRSARCDPDLTWGEAGGDSLLSLHLLLRLERALGRRLSFDLIDADMTAASLARSLEAPLLAADYPEGPAFFLIPGVYGDEPALADFRRALRGNVGFALQDLPDLDECAATLADLGRTAAILADTIDRAQPSGKVFLAGYSFGGFCAFEVARQLIRKHREIGLLAILDASALEDLPPPRTMRNVVGRAVWRALGPVVDRDAVRRTLVAGLRRRWPRWLPSIRHRLLWRYRSRALTRWRPAPLHAPILLAVSDESGPDSVRMWSHLAPFAEIVHLPGPHRDIFRPPALPVLRAALLHAANGRRRARAPASAS